LDGQKATSALSERPAFLADCSKPRSRGVKKSPRTHSGSLGGRPIDFLPWAYSACLLGRTQTMAILTMSRFVSSRESTNPSKTKNYSSPQDPGHLVKGILRGAIPTGRPSPIVTKYHNWGNLWLMRMPLEATYFHIRHLSQTCKAKMAWESYLLGKTSQFGKACRFSHDFTPFLSDNKLTSRAFFP